MTNLRDMDAPPVGSGAVASETMLKGLATTTSAEKDGNPLEEYKTPAQPTKELGGQNKFN